MPLDVPIVSYAVPDGVDPVALLSFLGERFTVVADSSAPAAFTVLDTVDRRVRAAGADLELQFVRSGARVVLREHGGRAPLAADVGRARRYTVDDLPAGPLRERLAPIVEMRALLPLAQVRVDARSLRVLNADDKTVVRLTLATRAALDTGAEPVPLTPRVDVTGVLGYDGPHARVVAVLGREAGLVDAPASLADEAIAAVGGDPEGLRTKVRVELRPRNRTDVAAVAVLDDLAGMVEANLPGTLDDGDTEFLHELRGAAFREAWDSYRAFLNDLGPARERPDAKVAIAASAGRRIRKVHRRMVAMGSAIDEVSPATDLHELRKRGKELRYLLELFGGLWSPDVVKPLVRSLKGLQDVLGVHQDREVQAEHLRGLAGELAGVSGGPEALLSLGVLVERLEAEQHEARQQFGARFAAFASDDQQRTVARTFVAKRAGRSDGAR